MYFVPWLARAWRPLAVFLLFYPIVACPRALAGTGDDLVRALRRGGYVIYLATGTETCRNRGGSTERKAVARTSAAISRAAIAIGDVRAGPDCGATARVRSAFGRGVTMVELAMPRSGSAEEVAIAGAHLMPHLEAKPRAGCNTLFAGPSASIEAIAGARPAAGDAVVIAPDDRGSYTVAGRLTARYLGRLAPATATERRAAAAVCQRRPTPQGGIGIVAAAGKLKQSRAGGRASRLRL